MRILIMDDDEKRISSFLKLFSNYTKVKQEDIDTTDNARDCIEFLSKNKYDYIFLDHDLDGRVFVKEYEENTGSEVARWIYENQSDLDKDCVLFVHSLNENGANYMLKKCLNIFKDSMYVPFAWTESLFKDLVKDFGIE